MVQRLTIGFILLGLICICFATQTNGPARAVYRPITVTLNPLKNEDFGCDYGEGGQFPNNDLGRSLIQIAESKYNSGITDNSNGTHLVSPGQTEGFIYPLHAKINKYFHQPREFNLGYGVAGEIYLDRAYFFGGTNDVFAYENLLGGYPLANTLGEIYSFRECKCSWELRGLLKNGFAFTTAQQWSFPACNIVKTVYCSNKRYEDVVNNGCVDYPFQNFCGNDVIVLFGGTNGTTFSNKVVFYNPNNGAFSTINSTYNGVTPNELQLAGHSSFIAGDSLYVIGGLRQTTAQAPTFSNSVYRYSLATQTWTVVTAASTSFTPLAFHTAVHYGNINSNSVLVNGGLNPDGTLNNNNYRLDIDQNTNTYTVTTLAAPNGLCKPATFAHAAQVNSGNIYYYGGAELDTGIVRFPIPVAGQPVVVDHSYAPFGELWRYNIETNTWFNLTQIHPYLQESNGPVMLEYNDELLIFGGIRSFFNVSTGVFRIAVSNPSYVTRPCCAPGYKGKNCDVPICSNNCGGPLVGVCVAPDTCQCNGGFTGNLCQYHVCSTEFNEDLIALNDVLFYPKASTNIVNKINQILQRLKFLRANLRPWKADSLVTKYEQIANLMYQFNTNNLDLFLNDLKNEVASLLTTN